MADASDANFRIAIGPTASIEATEEAECDFTDEHIIFGRRVNAVLGPGGFPKSNLGGAKRLRRETHYDTRNYVLPVKALQGRMGELRPWVTT